MPNKKKMRHVTITAISTPFWLPSLSVGLDVSSSTSLMFEVPFSMKVQIIFYSYLFTAF